ncbi:MAG: hypothetical protein PF508_10840 [Spirochaeta sp.]|jgi:hypothetical protein|nr:hypothetical protein [Spirochaeta sp.]
MYDYNARIREISDVRHASQLECERLRRIIGRHFVEHASEDDVEAAPLVAESRQLSDQIEKSSSALERMIRIDERQTEIRMKMKALQKELEHIESGRGLEGAYEQVGAAAFRLFREHPLVDATYSSAFAELARYQDELRRIETRIGQVQTDPNNAAGSVFNRMSKRGRGFMLRKRRTVKENQLPGMLQRLGRDLASTDFFDAMEDAELTAAAEPLREAEHRKSALRAEIAALTEESRNLLDEFNTLAGGNRLSRAQQRHEEEIATARNELNDVLLRLGSVAEKRDGQDVSDELERLQNEEARKDHFDAVLARLEAGRLAIALQAEIDADERRRTQLEEEIAKLDARKEQVATDAAAKETERKNLLTKRGDETDLFDS